MVPERRKRLLVVIDQMEVGGSQRQIAHLLGALDRNAWEADLLYFGKASFMSEQLQGAGTTVRYLPKRARIDPLFIYRFSRLLARERYDLIHAFSITAEIWTVLARRFLRRPPPLVSSIRSLNLDAPAWQWQAKRVVLRNSAATIANSKAAAHAVSLRVGAPVEAISVIGNGVAMPPPMAQAERQALRDAIGVPAGRTFALFVGRLTQVKNIPCLLEAMRNLAPDRRPWLGIAGDGPLRESLRRLMDCHGLAGDASLLGERADAVRLMQAADFLVLCSDQESSSNALLEAMAAGCAVLASDVGGNPELVEHEHTGLLFAARDSGALAAALSRYTGNPGLRDRMANQARTRLESRHGLQVLATATAAVYERCLHRKAQAMRPFGAPGTRVG